VAFLVLKTWRSRSKQTLSVCRRNFGRLTSHQICQRHPCILPYEMLGARVSQNSGGHSTVYAQGLYSPLFVLCYGSKTRYDMIQHVSDVTIVVVVVIIVIIIVGISTTSDGEGASKIFGQGRMAMQISNFLLIIKTSSRPKCSYK